MTSGVRPPKVLGQILPWSLDSAHFGCIHGHKSWIESEAFFFVVDMVLTANPRISVRKKKNYVAWSELWSSGTLLMGGGGRK